MSSSQKTVKIISFLLFAVAVLFYVVGGVMLAGAGSLDDSARSTAFALSMVLFFEGLVYIVYAGLGIRGANNPRKIGGFRVLSVLAIVIDALNIGSSAISNPASLAQPTSLIVYASLVLSVAGFVASGRVVKELDR